MVVNYHYDLCSSNDQSVVRIFVEVLTFEQNELTLKHYFLFQNSGSFSDNSKKRYRNLVPDFQI